MVYQFMCMYRKSGIYTSAQLNVNEERTRGYFSNLYPQLILFIRTNNISAMESLVKKFFLEMTENEVWPETVIQSARNMVSCVSVVRRAANDGRK